MSQVQTQEPSPDVLSALTVILVIIIVIILGLRLFNLIERAYALKYKRPLFVHFKLLNRRLDLQKCETLETNFEFYKILSFAEKQRFEHRVAVFLKEKQFLGRDGLEITTEMQLSVAATATMLTFGFRNYHINLIDKIIIYPSAFFSNTNAVLHKGEFNPKLKALVLSWEHYIEGYAIKNDNINLGIHEFTHAIHLNSLKNNDISSTIFKRAFKDLTKMLASDKDLRQRLIASAYFRSYAFTNQYEFVAVIVETFIETPNDFKQQFPRIYEKTREMLNFNFARY
ncbi:MAG: zinc-dependent peptidase [Psychroserpens sp.]|uniref:zinc-dependent peptidase n=1 Tax=Psychroserpens sp. TaxID=2020870 RepID=UPI003C72456A